MAFFVLMEQVQIVKNLFRIERPKNVIRGFWLNMKSLYQRFAYSIEKSQHVVRRKMARRKRLVWKFNLAVGDCLRELLIYTWRRQK